jgi:hypothetical protein
MENYFKLNRDLDEEDKVTMFEQNISFAAHERVKAYKKRYTISVWSEGMKVLADSYGEHHEAKKYKSEFRRLEQGNNETFDSFYAKFSSLVPYGNCSDDSEEQEALREKLNDKFRTKILGQTFGSCMLLATHLRNIESELADLRSNQRAIAGSAAGGQGQGQGQGQQGQGRGHGQAPATAGASGGNKRVDRLNAKTSKEYDWKKAGEQYVPLTGKDLAKTNFCYACKQEGHNKWEKTCRLHRFRLEPNASAATVDDDNGGVQLAGNV